MTSKCHDQYVVNDWFNCGKQKCSITKGCDVKVDFANHFIDGWLAEVISIINVDASQSSESKKYFVTSVKNVLSYYLNDTQVDIDNKLNQCKQHTKDQKYEMIHGNAKDDNVNDTITCQPNRTSYLVSGTKLSHDSRWVLLTLYILLSCVVIKYSQPTK